MNSKCGCGFLEEIQGFFSPIEYEDFRAYLKSQVENGNLVPVISNKLYEKGKIFGGEWYKCNTCHEIWRLVAPDFPFTGLWEKVEV
ncbi:hypothetical protein LEP1GSC047_0209 [Leptospira inadai serovar Lyme str. 10]|uniref:Uncharacterized protein n=2 Tax=Leptospira inadai serovar Lyme TaxID=293084 RepID=V6I0W0_9LEPT|nr:hypothetical protein [Leptospira inadai]EQA38899.1 hypothetical protein LEP1GSC047_0209 [Leptospira inadai serovar Lyme str. 10]PNV72102.1 hypothetical protein BES34_019930 [Leptospira inadai serovar Lyme]